MFLDKEMKKNFKQKEQVEKQEQEMQLCKMCGITHSGQQCAVELVVFQWIYGGNQVQVAGSWNKWQGKLKLKRKQQQNQNNNNSNNNNNFINNQSNINNKNTIAQLDEDEDDQTVQISLSLPVGTYQYKFIVDGQWIYDITQPTVPDGHGSCNNIIEVFPKIIMHGQSEGGTESSDKEEDTIEIDTNLQNFKISKSFLINEDDDDEQQAQETKIKKQEKIESDQNIRKSLIDQNKYQYQKIKIKTNESKEKLKLLGSWDKWEKDYDMKLIFNSLENQFENFVNIKLLPGNYYYKFKKEDNSFIHDPNIKFIKNSFGTFDNFIVVSKINKKNSKLKLNQSQLYPNKIYWKKTQIGNAYWNRIQGHTMNLIGDHLYIYGGQTSGDFIGQMSVMNIRTNYLDLVEYNNQSPQKRAFHQSISYGNKILFYGGFNQNYTLSDYNVFNTTEKQWYRYQLKGDQPSKRERFSLTQFGRSNLVLFGGYLCTIDTITDFHYNDSYALNLENMKWVKLNNEDSDLPEARFAHSSKCIHKKMYIFGGMHRCTTSKIIKNFNDIWYLNLDTLKQNLKWHNITNNIQGKQPEARHGHSMSRLQNILVFFGGRGQNNTLFNDVFLLDIQNNTWVWPQLEGEGPSNRCYHSAQCVGDNEILIVGGLKEVQQKDQIIHVYSLNFENCNNNSPENSGDNQEFNQNLDKQNNYQLNKIYENEEKKQMSDN